MEADISICAEFLSKDAAAVEKIFNVKVEKVATIRVLGKTKRMGRTQGKRSDYKKAIVTLKAGESITLFEGV